MKEIERKFLLSIPLTQVLEQPHSVKSIQQCYLGKTGEWTVRARQVGQGGSNKYYLTMKKRETDRTSIEIETPISGVVYAGFFEQSEHHLSKDRHEILHEGHLWEVDLFENDMIIAEIELTHEDEEFVMPDWIGEEVTHDKKYRSNKIAKGLERD